MNDEPRSLVDFPWDGGDWGGVMRFGPLVADERELRLIGNPAGRRVLLLGCGAGQAPATLAAAGARVIAVDPSPDAVEATRRHSAAKGLAVEVQERDLAELAFVRAETIDVALSLLTLSRVADLGRVFRQVHRVLRADAPIVVSLRHPVLATVDAGAGRGLDTVAVARPYGEPAIPANGAGQTIRAHTIEVVVTALTRVGFRLDTLLELMARPAASAYWQPAMQRLPAVLVVRARKTGL
jgi:SAM-dependent methyltransferase